MTSTIAVPIPRPSRNLSIDSCRSTPFFSLESSTVAHTFNVASTNLIPPYPPFPFGISNIFTQASSSGSTPYANANWIIRTTFDHKCLTNCFFWVTLQSQPFKSSARIPKWPPALPPYRPLTAAEISVSSGTPSSTSPVRTNTGTRHPPGRQNL